VATDLPHFAGLAAQGTLRTASGVGGFASALDAALAEPAAARAERSARAAPHDWERRIDELLVLVAERSGEGAGAPDAGGEGGVR
jgi:hypothetical protein